MNALDLDSFDTNVVELDAGPGQRLRQGREAVNLSVEEVAARLHLDARTISCLEGDQYDDLPAPTFVRGYLRSYARLLNIPAEPIIDGFDRRGLEPPALVADISTHEEARSTDAPMRVATIALTVLMFAGVMLWWQTEIGPDWQTGPPGSDAAEPVIPTTLEPTLPPLQSTEAPTESESLAQAEGVTAVALPANPPAAETLQETARAPDAPAPDAVEAAVDNAGAAAASTPPGVAHLVLRIRRDSWVEIYDRDGERLYYSTGKAGEVIDIRGAEPVQALVGFAEGVVVEYNGDPFDLAPHTARGLARFTLGGQ
ncbi:MAG: RodZ domain-containing protein [Pseudomonadota bacterium]